MLDKVSYCAAIHPAYHLASEALDKIGDISITGRHSWNTQIWQGQAANVLQEMQGEQSVRG